MRSGSARGRAGPGERGETLVGLIVAMAVFTVFLSGMFWWLTSLSRNTEQDRLQTRAACSAQAKMEEMKYNLPALTPGRKVFQPSGFTVRGKPAPIAYYEVRKSGRLAEITVVVGWGNSPGQNVILATMVRVP